MTPKELNSLIRKNEGLKLDFKREYKLQDKAPEGVDRQSWNRFVTGQWQELVKDVLALTNGNFGTVKQPGNLVIGVDDQLSSNGSRQLYDSSYLKITSQQLLTKVNEYCYPPIPDLTCEFVELEGYKICVISIPPSPHVHETTRPLEIYKGDFDTTGKLIHLKTPPKTYTNHTVFVRRGEDIYPATQAERQTLLEEKDLLFKSSTLNKSGRRNSNASTTNTSFEKIPKPTKLPLKMQIQKNLQESLVGSLENKYRLFKIGITVQLMWSGFIVLLSLLLGEFPSEFVFMFFIPVFILLICLYFFYRSLKSSDCVSEFFDELRSSSQRKEVRENLCKEAKMEGNTLDRHLYSLYINSLLYLVLPSSKKDYWL